MNSEDIKNIISDYQVFAHSWINITLDDYDINRITNGAMKHVDNGHDLPVIMNFIAVEMNALAS
jgi:hypothetical protein